MIYYVEDNGLAFIHSCSSFSQVTVADSDAAKNKHPDYVKLCVFYQVRDIKILSAWLQDAVFTFFDNHLNAFSMFSFQLRDSEWTQTLQSTPTILVLCYPT